ncbi:nucleotidyltransferase [Tuberibacillus sp. Marseille-P3662]|uniref:nucleotidyltransferase n=1 Tax=Tuberibacillus sp. Marseille-P3662 TaxID=1965358 RepID=UPI000A1CDE9F|nr:nucleotidyltransferase [Tuberibacillus sp. Marseille-P3662]
MKAAGVIVEYNPLHNGHLYHLQETIKQTGADVIIAVMSGNFLQRGEPAITSKWTRTKMALDAGIDLVIELPYAFATQNAEIFAGGAISILKALKVDHLCFGSEAGDVAPFMQTLEALQNHHDQYQKAIKTYMGQGNSYPTSLARAFKQLDLPADKSIDLSQPNNILGFHYIKAMSEQNHPMTVHTVKRKQAGYHDLTVSDANIASATSLRRMIFNHQGGLLSAEPYIPNFTLQRLQKEAHAGRLTEWSDFFPYLKYRLLSTNIEHLGHIYEAEEGLENRLQQNIREANTFNEFMTAIKTKRYTWTRLQRLLTHTLINVTKDRLRETLQQPSSPYIRLLGMTTQGQTYLHEIKDTLSLPLVANVNRFNHPLLTIDETAAQLYNFIVGTKPGSMTPLSEHRRHPIRRT